MQHQRITTSAAALTIAVGVTFGGGTAAAAPPGTAAAAHSVEAPYVASPLCNFLNNLPIIGPAFWKLCWLT